ncbi:MAG TPA: DUF1622 domain-containing protein [Cyclobacteriaceae bacterium]|nr:DUF1622 domain-containing protein [Cyclobacteriaceae bacterium]
MEGIEYTVKLIALSLGSLVEGIAALIIAHAISKSAFLYLKSSFQGNGLDYLVIRLNLGKKLALALEFLLAADILRTAVAPTWDEIGKLSAIAVLRTMLNYFLERELEIQHDLSAESNTTRDKF